MMEKRDILIENVNILQRRLSGLKDAMAKNGISDAQKKFLSVYQEVINEYVDKSFDILDVNKFKQTLIEMEE